MQTPRYRILCVEDEPSAAALIAEDLAERRYEVSVAYDGQEALDSILAKPPHLILADINMPGMSGFDLLTRVCEAGERYRRIPFLLLTALADRDNELTGWQRGADDYIRKPVDFDLLAARIAAHLARASGGETAESVGLGKRETETLMWAARGKSSSEIAQILGISKRTVDFHITNARTKLGVATRTQAVIKATTSKLIEP